MYNYGSPRVGNAAFSRGYIDAVPCSWRMANDYDLVTVVPLPGRYQHVESGLVTLDHGQVHVPTQALATLINLQLFHNGPDAEEVRRVWCTCFVLSAMEGLMGPQHHMRSGQNSC
jgi:hypothetical protein